MRQARLGKLLSPSTKRKISRSLKKRLKEPEMRKKWSDAGKGRIITPETRRKLVLAHKRRPKTIKMLKAKADSVFSQYIRLRDSQVVGDERIGICITCNKQIGASGKRTGQAGHFISRRYSATRYDERNVNLQCAGCNMWGGGEQYKYSLAIDKKYGKGTAEELYNKAHDYSKTTKEFLETIITNSLKNIKTIEEQGSEYTTTLTWINLIDENLPF